MTLRTSRSFPLLIVAAVYAASLAVCHAAAPPLEPVPAFTQRPAVLHREPGRPLPAPKASLPAGFEISTAAAAPLVTFPTMGCVDDKGRLFIGDAVGVNWNKAALEANPPNRVLMLEDTDGDGVYDKSTVFADRMTFPQGACWFEGSLYVASPPGIWKLTDTDGDGVADQREMIVSGFDYTGNAADVHGPWAHPDGRLYWCHGRKGHKVVGKDGTVVHEGLACGIWSCRPDGSDVRWHSLGCGDNPVKVDFTPEGEIIGVQNLYYSQPRGDTLIHWLAGGVYERADMMKAIEGLPRTLEHMPVMFNFGHVAVSGLCFGHQSGWGDVGALQLFVTHFNTGQLVRMELTRDGATYQARENDFLKVLEPDTHLTDVIEDRDGSLLVLNTGGWFRIGCPSSLMARPEALGCVYRVRKTGAVPAPRPMAKNPAPLASPLEALASQDAPTQLRACEALAEQRGAGEEVFTALHTLFKAPLDPALEHAAIRAYAQQKVAQQALAEPKPDGATPEETDRQEKRMILQRAYAAGTPEGAAAPLELQRLSAFLQQLGDDGFVSTHPQSLEACAFVLRRVKETPDILQRSFAEWLAKPRLTSAQQQVLEVALEGKLDSEAARKTIAGLLGHPAEANRLLALRLLAGQTTGLSDSAWEPLLEKMLAENPTPLLLDAIHKMGTKRFDDALQAITTDSARPLSLRLKALASMKGVKLTGDTFTLAQGVLSNAGSSPSARMEAAAMLASAPLTQEQLLTLAPHLGSVGPVELQKLLPLLRKAKDADTARRLAVELAKNPVIASQQESVYRTALSAQPPEIFETVILPALRQADTANEAKMRMLPALAARAAAEGQPAAGRAVYESGRGTCIACHQIGDKGRAIGPNLSHIGAIRTERDLVESILFPSNTIARDYEAHIIETSDGQVLTGVIRSHTAEGLLLVDLAGQETNLPHGRIVGNTTLPTSLMPMGLDQTLTPEELLNLVAFLRSLK